MFGDMGLEHLGKFLVALGIGLVLIGSIMGYLIFHNSSIESDKLITPTIKLVIKNNKVDTLYIYQK